VLRYFFLEFQIDAQVTGIGAAILEDVQERSCVVNLVLGLFEEGILIPGTCTDRDLVKQGFNFLQVVYDTISEGKVGPLIVVGIVKFFDLIEDILVKKDEG
jgi:hypothetical protein